MARFVCLMQKIHQRSIPVLIFLDLKWFFSLILNAQTRKHPFQFHACEERWQGGEVGDEGVGGGCLQTSLPPCEMNGSFLQSTDVQVPARIPRL